MPDYALVSSSAPTEFDESILRFLQNWPSDKPPRSYLILALPEEPLPGGGEVTVYTWRTTLSDMMVLRGYLDLQINHEALLENLGCYLQEARREGILPCQREDEENEEGGDSDGEV